MKNETNKSENLYKIYRKAINSIKDDNKAFSFYAPKKSKIWKVLENY